MKPLKKMKWLVVLVAAKYKGVIMKLCATILMLVLYSCTNNSKRRDIVCTNENSTPYMESISYMAKGISEVDVRYNTISFKYKGSTVVLTNQKCIIGYDLIAD